MSFVIGRLPQDANATQLKQIAGSKSVVSATIDKRGSGLVKVKLGGNVTEEQIKYNFKRLGYCADLKKPTKVVELKL